MSIKKISIIGSLIPFLLLAGCASNNSAQEKPVKQEVNKVSSPAQNSTYFGKENQAKLETAAKSQSKNATAQIEAAKSAYVNGDFKKSISYYQQAIKIDPKNVVAFNNLGNVYFRGLNNPKNAIQFYTKATQVNPSYSFGWLNLALAQKALGQKKEAQRTITTALKHVTQKDANYKQLINAKK